MLVNETNNAAAAYQQVIDNYADSKDAPNALFELASMEFRTAGYEDAQSKFIRIVQDYRDSKTARFSTTTTY